MTWNSKLLTSSLLFLTVSACSSETKTNGIDASVDVPDSVVPADDADAKSAKNSIWGTATNSFDVAFDSVVILRQEKNGSLDGMVLHYENDGGEILVKLNANAPIQAGEPRDLAGSGCTLTRVTEDGSAFPELRFGSVTFSRLEVGETTEGEFSVRFVNGQTLAGSFVGEVTAAKQ